MGFIGDFSPIYISCLDLAPFLNTAYHVVWSVLGVPVPPVVVSYNSKQRTRSNIVDVVDQNNDVQPIHKCQPMRITVILEKSTV
jgi:hypothetical protein